MSRKKQPAYTPVMGLARRKTGRPDEERIRQLFDIAVEKSNNGSLDRYETHYKDGVRAALGWVLGEYDEEPEL